MKKIRHESAGKAVSNARKRAGLEWDSLSSEDRASLIAFEVLKIGFEQQRNTLRKNVMFELFLAMAKEALESA